MRVHPYNVGEELIKGHPVGVITAPLVIGRGDFRWPVGDWTVRRHRQAALEIVVDMSLDEYGSDVDEEDQQVEAKEANEEQEEDKGRRDAVAK